MQIGGGGAKAKDFNKTIRNLSSYLKPYKVSMIIVICFAFLSTVFSIVGPKLLGKVTTKLAEGLFAYYARTGLLTDFNYMGKIIILLVVLYTISAVCSYVQGYMMAKVSMDVTYKLRKNISEKMNRIPLNYYDTRTHGEVLSRITNDVDVVSQTLNQSLTQIITSVTSIVGVLGMMLSISWLMTLVALLVVPLSMIIVGVVIKRSQGYFKDQQKYLGEINGHVEEMYGGHNIVQAFNGEQESIEIFEKVNDKLYHSAWKSQFVSSIMMPVMGFVGNLGYVLVSILGGYLAVKKVVDIGDIQAFIQYMRSFTQPIGQLASISNTLQSTVAAAERVFEFLEEDEEIPETPTQLKAQDFCGNVTFENVSFGYNKDKLIIHDFSAKIKAGQRIAIVGPTGAGKTTIVKLLMRFYDIDNGKISIDGHDIYDFTRNDLRAMFGMVLQETWLYNASIKENIRYGTPEATDEEVIEAAKAAHCDEFIRALPDGYDMILNEEASNISQGQKQLFTIARVILANPKILILDEATSSVDTRTEILIQKAMDHLMKSRTSFVIAHRLSTVKDSDLILVMKDGDIIEQGNHEELLAQKGFYAGLYNSQFAEE
ncbi:ABC transporter ATP-binding protein [Desulfosporosinus sp. BG]|uniref:ABC transporter ATP-binding protein n=1 Tax=Desulfosporosinus sp. BG TaxID=1633135 RepID=UPI001FA6F700|nr:ABC transporter ATP-binding protein [Desulfosporosinus sp. BG]